MKPSNKLSFLLFTMVAALFVITGVVTARESETAAKDVSGIDPANAEAVEIALAYLHENKASLGLAATDLADIRVTDTTVSRLTGVTTVYFVQRLDGVEVHNGLVNISVNPDGTILIVGNRFVPNLVELVTDASAELTPQQAVEAAADHLNLTISQPLQRLSSAAGPDQETLFTDGGISQNDIPAKLVIDASGDIPRLAWNVIIYQLDSLHWWNVRIDANTGSFLSKNDWVVSENFDAQVHEAAVAQEARQAAPAVNQEIVNQAVPFGPTPVADGSSYRVYHLPVESPSHASPPPPADARTLEDEPADAIGSPYGWHDTDGDIDPDFTTTQGNNVHAYTDTDANNTPDPGSSPDGGAGLDFDFPLDLTQPPSAYRPAAVTNLFHWNNLMHDVNYRYGFDEIHGNFQENNYGNGGLGSDYVNAEAQDGSGTNNANFATPSDGNNPRMQMYVGTNPTPDVDGDLDNGVIAHEYGHGISNRMVGGPANVSCLNNSEQMGEGWSDWQLLIMTMENGDTGPDPRGVGTYLFGQPPNGPGIRPAPYSTDFGVNNYTYGDIGGLAVPHGVGFVWATVLWEMNWALIAEHGFNEDIYLPDTPPNTWSGNQLAHALVTEGFNHTPCSPGFVDGRDAILAADQALTGGANQCTIWQAFATRGLGFSADQGSSGSTGDGTEAFDMPLFCLTLDVTPTSIDICQGDTAVYTVNVGLSFTPPVAMSASGNPAPTTATFVPNPVVTVPSTTTLTIDNTAIAPTGNYTVTILGDDGAVTDTFDVGLNVFDAAPGAAPTLMAPPDGAIDVSFRPTFGWTAVANATAYYLEVAEDPGFTTIVYTATVDTNTHMATSSLMAATTYYWRVSAENVCGSSAPSAAFSFTTQTSSFICDGAIVDFEGGIPGDWTVVNNQPGNPVFWTDITGCDEAGNYATGNGDAACASSDLQGGGSGLYDTELWSPPFDLTNAYTATLDYWAIYGNFAGVDFLDLDISTDGGTNWTNLLSWNEDHHPNGLRTAPGENVIVDLGAYAGTTPILRWHYYDPTGPASSQDWYTQLDEIALICGEPSPTAQINLQKTVGTDPNVCATTNEIMLPQGGGTVYYCYEVFNSSSVTLTLHDLVDTELGVLLDDFPYELTPLSSVFITQSAAVTETTVNTATWTAFNPGPIDVASDSDSATVNVLTSAPFPVCAGFESGSLPDFMYAETVDAPPANGRVQVTTAFPHSGSYGLDIDTDCDGCGGSTLQSATMIIDLGGVTGAELDFWVWEHGDENNPEDGVFISDDDGVTWAQIVNLNNFPNSYQNVVLDLAAAASGAGMSLVDGFLIRFQSYDNFSIATDGYSFDDICVFDVAPPPVIDVTPATLASSQGPDVMVTLPLTISNLGGSDLDWNIFDGGMDWSDNFDSYPTGSQMHGQGGWKGWDNDPAFGAVVTDVQALSAPNSVDIVGASDLVHEYSGYTGGLWRYTAWQYIPAAFTGEAYFILLNTYADGGPNNWSTQVHFNATQDQVIADGAGGGSTLPLIRGQWVEIRVDIDLDNDIQSFYYDGALLFTGSWTNGLSGGGALNIGAVDLFANGSSSVYYDDLSLMEMLPGTCEAPGNVPWLSASPTSGTTAPGADSLVDVTFDSTAQTPGVYTSTLCVDSNDPVTPLVAVPVTMTVTGEGYGVELNTADADLPGLPGETVAYTLNLTNTGSTTDTFTLTLSGNVWSSTLPGGSSVTLGAGETGSFQVAVTIPADAMANDMDTVTVTATSTGDPGVSDAVDLTTTAEAAYAVDVSTADADLSGAPGEVLTYSVTVSNNGNADDTYNLAVTGNAWTTVLETVSVIVPAGDSVTVEVYVTVPAGAADGEMDVATVSAISVNEPAATDSLDLTSTAVWRTIYLPFMAKP